jgi:hypothetical protein
VQLIDFHLPALSLLAVVEETTHKKNTSHRVINHFQMPATEVRRKTTRQIRRAKLTSCLGIVAIVGVACRMGGERGTKEGKKNNH